MTHINKIKEIVASEKEILSKELFDAAVNADIKQVEVLSKEVQLINELNAYLSKQDSSDKKKSKKRNSSETTTPHPNSQNNPVMDSEITVVPITENLTNKRPVSIEMDGKTELVNSFRSLTETACRMAYNKDSNKFNELCNNPNVNGDKHMYFAKTNNGMTDPAMIGSGRSAVFVDVSKLAINNMYFLKKALAELGYKLEDVKISINPTYNRKPREKKQA